MKSSTPIFRASLMHAALLTVVASSHAAEQVVDAGTTDLTVASGTSVWFDSANTNLAIPLGTINGTVPATGPLPGWAHTRSSFLKYDGANVVEILNTEKKVGFANLPAATATAVYFDNGANTTLPANQTIGLVETTRDFIIANGSTLDIAKGGLMFSGGSHWVKGGGFLTSSSGQLTVVTNGGQPNYRIDTTVVKNFNATTPLTLVKTGPDTIDILATNTYTGGTWINNGRMRAPNLAAYGPSGLVRVQGANSQACLALAGNFGNSFQIEGLGWVEGTEQRGAIRFEAAANVTGAVSITGNTRMTVNTGVTGAINGTLSGSSALELGFPGATLAGTLNLNGDGTAMTGPVTVSTGSLNVIKGLGGSVTVAGGAGLGGESTLGGSLTIGGAIPSILTANGTSEATLAVTGAVDLSPGTTTLVVINPPVSATSFTAFTYGSFTGPATNLLPSSLRGGTASDDAANSRVLVNFTPGTLTWTGTANATWAQNGDLNFSDGTATNFFSGDKVSFTEDSPVKTLGMAGLLYPAELIFDHSSDYTITGPNAGIGGATGLTKNGTGTLTLGGQLSNFTGPVIVNAGCLKLGANAEALGMNSGITITSGGQIDLNGIGPRSAGRIYNWTITGNGPDGYGAIVHTKTNEVRDNAGIANLTLSGDASVGTTGRLDLAYGNAPGVLRGNGFTLTKNGAGPMALRGDASVTPINIVIAAGNAWGENTDNAYGGATGTVRVKGGARVGTYGPRTIATPLFLEAGATLYNQGNNTGTWTGAVTLEGNATVDTSGGVVDVIGTVTGNFSLTKTGSFPTYLAEPLYTGNTIVNAGVLTLGTASLGDSSTVSISNTAGTKLDLVHGESDTIASLVIDGVPQAAGTYGSSESGATNVDDVHFSGAGMLNVVSSGDPYTAWATVHGIGGAAGAVDSDGDGIANAIEFVIGGNPSGQDAATLLPTIDNSDPTYFKFTFRRSAESASANPYVQYGSDISGWTQALAGAPAANPVAITEVNHPSETGIVLVTVKIPRALAVGSKLFVRLRVDIP